MYVDGEIWHYTTADGLIGILSENVLRASSTAFMNDHREIHIGRDLWSTGLKTALSGLQGTARVYVESLGNFLVSDNPSDVYVACSCRSGDNLTMWRNYAGNQVGFAVQFDLSQRLFMRRQRCVEDVMTPSDEKIFTANMPRGAAVPARHVTPPEQLVEAPAGLMPRLYNDVLENLQARPLAWEDAIYSPTKQEEIVGRGLAELIEQATTAQESGDVKVELIRDFVKEFERTLQTFKHNAFEDERERRVVCAVPPNLVKKCFLKYRPGEYGVVPYVELGVPEGDEDRQADPGSPQALRKLPILSVTVGPTPYPEAAKAGVRDLLGSYGYDHVGVTTSEIPFRR